MLRGINPIAVASAWASSLPPPTSRRRGSEDCSDAVRAEMTYHFRSAALQRNREPASHVGAKCHSAQKLTPLIPNRSQQSGSGTTRNPDGECDGH